MNESNPDRVAQRYDELKRLMASYTEFIQDLPVTPERGGDLGPAFETSVLEAHFLFPSLSTEEREALALVRLAGANILARYLMSRATAQGLAEIGLQVGDRAELDRVTRELEADFVACRKNILAKGIVEKLTPVQRMFWEEWSNPLHAIE